MRRITIMLASLALFVGCDANSTGPEVRVAGDVARADPVGVRVLTRNVYVGDDIESVLAATNPALIPLLVAQSFADVQATNFFERAEALADEIHADAPHLVGLQEVSLFRLQSPGDFLIGNPQAAETVVLDYLQILLDALAARGLSYVVAATSTNFDFEVPMATPGGLDDIRLTDFDVVLARSDVPISDAGSQNFAINLPVNLGGVPLLIRRGWAWADVTVNGRNVRFVNTHLEPATPGGVLIPELEQIQLAQLGELLGFLAGTSRPVILTGDFNSAADGSSTSTYAEVLESGFVDAWTIGRPRGDGFTANQDPDLANPASKLFQRIDFVFYRDAFTARRGRIRGAVQAKVVGGDPTDRTPSGLWPSDHAGVSVTLHLAPRRGLAE
ncbi:MAG: endonuclease/exonuclease/phosphatase family protein [Gemmatimonadota bacterium]